MNTNNPKPILPSNSSLIDIATKEMQGEKHNNFFKGLGRADKKSSSNVENNNGVIIPNKIMSNASFLYNSMKNILSPRILRYYKSANLISP